MNCKYYFVVLFALKSFFSFSQTVSPGAEIQELVKIYDVYSNVSNLSFNLKYTFADSLTWQDLTDSAFATCKLSHGRTLITDSSFEQLSGDRYNVFVDKEDSLIYVARKMREETILKVPLLDSLFRSTQVDTMYILEITDTIWRFIARFKPESFYSYYELNYNPQNYLIQSVNYHARNDGGAYEIPSDHVVCATIYMTDYSFAELDPALFNENRYFYELNGHLYLQPAWELFEFENY